MNGSEIEDGEIVEEEDFYNEIDNCQNTIIPYDPSDSLLRLHSIDSSSSKFYFTEDCPSPSLSEEITFDENFTEDLDVLELRKLALGSMVDNVIKTPPRKPEWSKSSRKRRKSSSIAKQRRQCQMQIHNLHSMQEKAFSLEVDSPKCNIVDKQIELTFKSFDKKHDIPINDNYEPVAMDLESSGDDTETQLVPFEENIPESINSELYSQVASSYVGGTQPLLELKSAHSNEIEVNDIDLELLRQKALETLFKSSQDDNSQPISEIEDILTPEEALINPPIQQDAEILDCSKIPLPSEIPADRFKNKLPPLMKIQKDESPVKTAKTVSAPASRKPFIIQIGGSSSDEESNSNGKQIDTPSYQLKYVANNKNSTNKTNVVNNLKADVPPKKKIVSSVNSHNASTSIRLATIHKEMLRRKDHYLQSKLAVYKMKESLAKKKEFRHQALLDVKTLRRKLKLLTAKCKNYNQDITTEEKKLKTLEQSFKNEESSFSTYCDMVRSYIKKKKAPKNKIKFSNESFLVELLGRASVSCLHHFLFQIDFDYVLSAEISISRPSSQPLAQSKNKISVENTTKCGALPESTVISKTDSSDGGVEGKESLIAKSIVSHLRNLSTSDANEVYQEIHEECYDSYFQSPQSSPRANSSEKQKFSSNNYDIENKTNQLKLMPNNSKPLTEPNRGPLKDSQNPILTTQTRNPTVQLIKKNELPHPLTVRQLLNCRNISLSVNLEANENSMDFNLNANNQTAEINHEVEKAFENLTSASLKTPAINVHAIICPFIIDGVCLDKDCEFEHPDYLKNTDESDFKKASCTIEQDLKSNQSLFDPVLFQINQPLNLVSHLDCKVCSMRIAISTHHLIDDPECATCLNTLLNSNYSIDDFIALLHHLQFRIFRKKSRGEDTTILLSSILDVCKTYQSKSVSLPDYALKHCIVIFSLQTADFASTCLNLLKNHDFPPEVCIFALDLCKDYASKKEIATQSLLYSKSTENSEILNHLLLIYCRLEYMAGRTKQAQSFLLDSIKGFSNCSPTSDQISELYFTVRLYLDWILLDYLPYNFQTYRPFSKKTILQHEESIMFLYDCLFPGIFQNPIKTICAVDSLSFTPHLVYLFHIFIDFLSAKVKHETVLNITANLISTFGLKSFLFSFCHTAFKKSSTFSSTLTFLEKYFIKAEIIEKLYPAIVYLNAVLLIKDKKLGQAFEILESFSLWLFSGQGHSLRPYCLYQHVLQIDDSFIFHPLLRPKFAPSHPSFRKSLNYIWLNYALYGCLLGLHEEISYQLHKVCALHLLPHDDLHMVVHFLLRLLTSTVCKVQPLYYCKLAEKLCFYAVPDELECCSDYFNVEIAELVQQIKLNELTFQQRNEFCTNLIEKRSFNLPLLMNLVKSLIAGSSSQDHYLAFSLCQAASFDNPKYEEFWLLYLEMIRLNKLSDEVVNLMLSKSVTCLPESQRLWRAYYSFSVKSGKPKLQKSLKIELRKTGLFG